MQYFDVKNAFLHGDLDTTGYRWKIWQMQGLQIEKGSIWTKRVSKSIFEKFTHLIVKLKYYRSQGNHTLFIKHTDQSKVTALIVYVDDIIVSEDGKLKGHLAKEFGIIDWEELNTSYELK